ncbi:hypothetical protein F511_29680 [Dorcoceras hygrometricum]|uniref:Uncharacterized protein n=1 Tax=Dorcoceras hygrometricum TaxID=472368 RepID=A0A2Z7ATI9_9LAMI|nr:hypothetical protein F511_29680 [Dorcoceras hygrometricum]
MNSEATCWYLATAGLKPSVDYDDVTDDVISAKPSADSFLYDVASSLSLLFSSADYDDVTDDVISAKPSADSFLYDVASADLYRSSSSLRLFLAS